VKYGLCESDWDWGRLRGRSRPGRICSQDQLDRVAVAEIPVERLVAYINDQETATGTAFRTFDRCVASGLERMASTTRCQV
jgi:hypothetical protein